MLSVILLSVLMILSTLNVIRHLICSNNYNYLLNLQDTVDWGRKWLADFNAEKTQLVFFFDQSKNTGAIDVKMDESVLERKSSFKMLGLTFSSELDWCSYIISIARTTSKKIGTLICSMKFISF